VLLDEPLSSLDANKRDEVLILLKDLHENLRTTFVMVTHEFSQVMFLAQRAAIINSGRLEQVGAVDDIFHAPRTRFVAEFVGMKNLWPATFQGNTAYVHEVPIHLSENNTDARQFVGIRPEHIRMTRERPAEMNRNVFAATITVARNVGPYFDVIARTRDIEFRAFLTESALPNTSLTRGSEVFVAFDREAVRSL
jgi:molybdate/tungstate transport system ATP-binding protein